jgi:hypothetical protein
LHFSHSVFVVLRLLAVSLRLQYDEPLVVDFVALLCTATVVSE